MSLDKAIAHGREHRKPYYNTGRFDVTCRPHGGKARGRANQCPVCRDNRTHQRTKAESQAKGDLADIE